VSAQLAREATWWAHHLNVEMVFCWLPDFDQVADGTHTITAVGHDGMAVNIIVNNVAQALNASHGLAVEQVHLAYLGKLLTRFRYEEISAEYREAV